MYRVRRRRFAGARTEAPPLDFQHPLGEHRNPFSPLLDVCEVVKHFRFFTADGRRGARDEDIHWILGRLLGIDHFLTDSVVHRRGAAGRRGARIQGRHFGGCGKLFRERK